MAERAHSAPTTSGAPAWTLEPATIGGTLLAAAQRWPGAEALVIGERRATWPELFAEVVETARALIGSGIARGDHVGILMPNAWEYVVLFHASALIGARTVTLNARYRADDLAYVVPSADIKLLVVGQQASPATDYVAMLRDVFPDLADWGAGDTLAIAGAPNLADIVVLGDDGGRGWPSYRAFLGRAAAVTFDDVRRRAEAVSADDVALLMFSSGTTARPKACMLTHRNLATVGSAVAERFEMTSEDRFWDPLPLFHMSTMLPLAACRASGACFIGVERFEPAPALDALERERVTIFYPAFPTITTAILAEPDFASRDLSRIRLMVNVGPPDLLRRYTEALPGAALCGTYGLTEATGVIAFSEPTDTLDQRLTTSGRPFAGTQVRIVDPATGADLPPGERGEIHIRGSLVFAGYYNDPERTAAVHPADGWLRTGDVCSLDQHGRISYHGRYKDMLKIGGENVAALEIESFLQTHPAVLLAQVIGVPDERLVEVAAAFIELKAGATVSAEDLVRHCLGRIASYKVPRYVRFVDAWPMSATKIQKFRLLNGFTPENPFDIRAMLTHGGGKR